MRTGKTTIDCLDLLLSPWVPQTEPTCMNYEVLHISNLISFNASFNGIDQFLGNAAQRILPVGVTGWRTCLGWLKTPAQSYWLPINTRTALYCYQQRKDLGTIRLRISASLRNGAAAVASLWRAPLQCIFNCIRSLGVAICNAIPLGELCNITLLPRIGLSATQPSVSFEGIPLKLSECQ